MCAPTQSLSLLQEQLRAERIRNARAAAEARCSRWISTLQRICATQSERARAPDARDRVVRRAAAHARRTHRSLNAHARSAEASVSADRADRRHGSGGEARDRRAADQREAGARRFRAAHAPAATAARRSRLSQPAGENRGDLALARQRIGELQARIAQTRNQYQQQATDEAKESAARDPRTRRARASLRTIRPSGSTCARRSMARVMALRVAAIGEAIGPRDPILDIVPTQRKARRRSAHPAARHQSTCAPIARPKCA